MGRRHISDDVPIFGEISSMPPACLVIGVDKEIKSILVREALVVQVELGIISV